jgi:hypothetical protein
VARMPEAARSSADTGVLSFDENRFTTRRENV